MFAVSQDRRVGVGLMFDGTVSTLLVYGSLLRLAISESSREPRGAHQRSNGAFGVVLDCSQGGNFVRL